MNLDAASRSERQLTQPKAALLLGIEDPLSNAHAPNESLHGGDFRKLTISLAHLFNELGNLPDGKVKADLTAKTPEVTPENTSESVPNP